MSEFSATFYSQTTSKSKRHLFDLWDAQGCASVLWTRLKQHFFMSYLRESRDVLKSTLISCTLLYLSHLYNNRTVFIASLVS